jgi:hypothetical protein
MWALLNDAEDTIEELIQHPKTMVIAGTTYPRQVFKWSAVELKGLGIVPVTVNGSHLDSNYYIEVDETFAIASDKASVVQTIGVKAADKKLTDTNEVDENGDPFLDDHDNQTVTLGLTSQAKIKANEQANGYIKGFDWMIQRKVTHAVAINSDVLTYIAAVRSKHAEIITAITNADDMTKYIALHTTTYNEDGTINTIAKVQDWPDDYGVKAHRR